MGLDAEVGPQDGHVPVDEASVEESSLHLLRDGLQTANANEEGANYAVQNGNSRPQGSGLHDASRSSHPQCQSLLLGAEANYPSSSDLSSTPRHDRESLECRGLRSASSDSRSLLHRATSGLQNQVGPCSTNGLRNENS